MKSRYTFSNIWPYTHIVEDKNPNSIKTNKGGFGLVDYLFVESIVKSLEGEKKLVWNVPKLV